MQTELQMHPEPKLIQVVYCYNIVQGLQLLVCLQITFVCVCTHTNKCLMEGHDPGSSRSAHVTPCISMQGLLTSVWFHVNI